MASRKTKPRKAKLSGPSGEHVTPRRRIPAPPERAAVWDRAAEFSGYVFPIWAQRALTKQAAAELGIDEAAAEHGVLGLQPGVYSHDAHGRLKLIKKL